MMDKIGKLMELKKKMEEIRQRLDNITVDGTAAEGKVRISLSANRDVKEIQIDDELVSPERKGELTGHLAEALRQALEQSENVSRAELQAAGPGILPGT